MQVQGGQLGLVQRAGPDEPDAFPGFSGATRNSKSPGGYCPPGLRNLIFLPAVSVSCDGLTEMLSGIFSWLVMLLYFTFRGADWLPGWKRLRRKRFHPAAKRLYKYLRMPLHEAGTQSADHSYVLHSTQPGVGVATV